MDRLEGCNFVTGLPADQSAYRSELAGVIGILSALSVLVHQHTITSGSVTIALDGESALKEASGSWHLKIDQPHFDYLQEARNRIATLPISITWRWVKGHQREKGIQNLDWWAVTNDYVDSKAKAFIKTTCEGLTPCPLFPVQLLFEKWCLLVEVKKQATADKAFIYATLFAPRTYQYW